MSYGLINIQRDMDDQAMTGLSEAARREKEREMAGDQIESQNKANKSAAIGTGAGLGMAIGGPMGAVAGAGISYLAYELL